MFFCRHDPSFMLNSASSSVDLLESDSLQANASVTASLNVVIDLSDFSNAYIVKSA